ncbi:hypothetical protein [Mesorhizobium sp.]|uniref:hypothetical protein n=1 Tax=Mesorhizobium sp. TaxID=1871066 RepID=UPI003BAB0CA8
MHRLAGHEPHAKGLAADINLLSKVSVLLPALFGTINGGKVRWARYSAGITACFGDSVRGILRSKGDVGARFDELGGGPGVRPVDQSLNVILR